jgi:hypothetical protein
MKIFILEKISIANEEKFCETDVFGSIESV